MTLANTKITLKIFGYSLIALCVFTIIEYIAYTGFSVKIINFTPYSNDLYSLYPLSVSLVSVLIFFSSVWLLTRKLTRE